MSSLTVLVADVMALVVADMPGTTWAEGGREQHEHRSPPCVVWSRVSARPRGAAQRHDQVRSFDRSLLGLAQSYEVRLWGVSMSQLDDLRTALVRALEDLASGQYEYEGDTQTEVGAASAGEALVARISLACHIHSRPAVTVAVTSAGLSSNPAAAPRDGVLEPGDP